MKDGMIISFLDDSEFLFDLSLEKDVYFCLNSLIDVDSTLFCIVAPLLCRRYIIVSQCTLAVFVDFRSLVMS